MDSETHTEEHFENAQDVTADPKPPKRSLSSLAYVNPGRVGHTVGSIHGSGESQFHIGDNIGNLMHVGKPLSCSLD